MKLFRLLRSITIASLLLVFPLISFSQSFPVTGKITGADGQPLAGVTIQVQGTDTRTVSAADGTFQINAPSANSVLVFTYVGFTSQQVAIDNRQQLTIGMTPQENSLQDVVVVGYGTQRKSDVTGSLSRITAQTIQERPAQNLLQALQGKAAGVQVSTNFRPGELPVVRVRGNRSPNSPQEPLYVVDGIPLVS